jgi:predicted Zn-dependent protease
MKRSLFVIIGFTLLIGYTGCKKDDDGGGSGFNLFSIQDDIELGQQLQAEILSDPQNYPVLSPIAYAEAYNHIERIRDSILLTDKVAYDDVFEWGVHIIQNDTVLNAFATPGGYMYFYTGLIKYLDNEAQFAGVMGHEMAHAAERHSTNQLTKVYGLTLLVNIVLGQNPNQLIQIAADIAAGLAALAFSRDHEYEADEFSVKYLYETSYDARGVGGFFEKINSSPQPPQFLSTHPNPDNRIEEIEDNWLSLGGVVGNTYVDSYQSFKNSLP